MTIKDDAGWDIISYDDKKERSTPDRPGKKTSGGLGDAAPGPGPSPDPAALITWIYLPGPGPRRDMGLGLGFV